MKVFSLVMNELKADEHYLYSDENGVDLKSVEHRKQIFESLLVVILVLVAAYKAPIFFVFLLDYATKE